MTTTYYKVLNCDGTTCHGGTGQWHLPKGNRPGKWMPRITDPVCCARGYHVVTRGQVIDWLGPTLWEVEVRGEHDDTKDKSAFEQARLLRKLDTWDDRTARFFAADCAEHVLPIFEKQYSDDARPRQAIQAARDFARGIINDAAMAVARAAAMDAMDAARAAAMVAASDVAMAAAWAAAWDAAWAAARAAAWDAAWAAAMDAAWAAARDTEQKWQTKRLWQYLEEGL